MATILCKICVAALLILSLLPDEVIAQSQLPDRTYIPKLAVKYSPLHMIYFYPSIQVAVEHRLYRNLTIQYDAGIVFNYNENNSSADYQNRRGYRLIGELRYYLPFTRKVPFYLAAEGYYHNITFHRNAVLGYYSDNDKSYTYYQYIQHTVRTEQSGGGLKFGMLLYPAWNRNSRFFFDINGGLAIRNITYTNENLPPGNYAYFYDDDFNIFAPDENNHTELRPVLGIRIGYKIK